MPREAERHLSDFPHSIQRSFWKQGSAGPASWLQRPGAWRRQRGAAPWAAGPRVPRTPRPRHGGRRQAGEGENATPGTARARLRPDPLTAAPGSEARAHPRQQEARPGRWAMGGQAGGRTGPSGTSSAIRATRFCRRASICLPSPLTILLTLTYRFFFFKAPPRPRRPVAE